MSDFVGTALNSAELVTKVTGIAVDFLSGIGCEAFCEMLDAGKNFLFEAIRKEKLSQQTRKALENLDQRTVDDLKQFVGKELKKYSKKGKLPGKLKGKDLVDVFMNRLNTVSKLVDDYAAQNNLSEDRKIALKYILNEIRQCTAQASLDMLEAEDKRLVLVISQIVRNTFEDYREDFAPKLAKTLFYRPSKCSYCASTGLLYDDAKGLAACKNCGTKIEYTKSEQSDLLAETKAAFADEFNSIHSRLDVLIDISTKTLDGLQSLNKKIDSTTRASDVKSRLNIAQDYINQYKFSEACVTCREILKQNPDSIDAMWCYLQAEFGIVYLRGYNETKAKPTFCYPINPSSKIRFCDHEYYQKILFLLRDDPMQRSVYEARQREIDKAIATVKNDLTKKQDYDVFICVKIGLATENDQIVDAALKTVDFEQYAKKIYKELTDRGLKVFCSQISYQQGIAYDEQIWSAMLRSKKILVIGTRREYLESVWVQCEWRRWLYLKQIGVRDADSFIALVPSEDDWSYIRPREWEEKRITIYQDVNSAIEAITGKTAQPLSDNKQDLDVEIVDIRALLDRGQTAQAKKRLKPLLDAHPSSGELQLLDLRIRSDNFKNSKKISRTDIEVACRYLKSDANENPEYRMYTQQQRRVDEKPTPAPRSAPVQTNKMPKSPKPAKPRNKNSGCMVGLLVVLAIIAALLALVVWPMLIQPNLPDDDLYTPEIIQTYNGTYQIGRYGTNGEAIITITECDTSGNVRGYMEFIVGEDYGKYELSGQITRKSNNGNLTLTLTPGQWIVHPSNYDPLETMEVLISDNYQTFVCAKYNMNWIAGENEKYVIKTADDLGKLAGSNATYQLKNDIDLKNVNWTPIEGFTGTLIGNGFSIKNLKIQASSSNVGFFSTLKGTVTDLNFENATVTVSGRNENVGILCGSIESGRILGIHASGSVNAETCTNVGGIAGHVTIGGSYTMGDFSNSAEVTGLDKVGGVFGCVNNQSGSYSNQTVELTKFENAAAIVGKGNYVGGIIGYYCQYCNDASTLKATDLKNKGDVIGNKYVGGIFGYAETDSTASMLQDGSNDSVITGECYVGCIAGQIKYMILDNCSNAGSELTANGYTTVDGEKYAYVGGYAGYGYLANNCVNEVEISYTGTGSYVGGIIGYSDATGSYSMTGLKNNASILGYSYVGGIFGGVHNSSGSYSDQTVELTKLENTAAVEGQSDYVGGIAGYWYQYSNDNSILNATDLKNTGAVTGKKFVGGHFGYAETNATTSLLRDSSNNSKISGNCYVGCIAGQLKYVTIDNCTNDGSMLSAHGHVTVDGKQYAYVGGYVGYGYLANNCVNEVEISYTGTGSYVGGIIGYSDATGSYSMTGLKNNASILGYSYVGGIFGGVHNSSGSYSDQTVELTKLENTAAVEGQSDYVGGIAGYWYQNCNDDSTLYASECNNSGTVSGGAYVGGLFGYAETDSKNSVIMNSTSSSGNIAGELKNISVS